ncbi:Cytidine deaminase (Cytidine aminohydrolase) [Mycoplasmopsis californica]|uniref:Cytidine deaminase n=2 Tax=Mycoplasmopsis equigenitalium TaxID=114883 RepID=A0ABY5J0Q2_9BACT|nr:cytidine deaminase [Mycoplasmopsis equigenitalium]UUD36838.1 cytidine deaminase [Mycoplasmopsis equigenitalium]VEU69866.1 Cytidine deaminase (Cytidine aminohydrolase) [Mycoplasmopsis californica]
MSENYKEVKELLKKSYAPFSHFNVATIIIEKNGKKHYGVNVECAAYPSGLCAERNAIFSGVTNGLKPYNIKEMHLISSKNDTVINSCGGCLQVMNEFLDNEAKIYSYSFDGKQTRVTTIRENMPFVVSTELFD